MQHNFKNKYVRCPNYYTIPFKKIKLSGIHLIIYTTPFKKETCQLSKLLNSVQIITPTTPFKKKLMSPNYYKREISSTTHLTKIKMARLQIKIKHYLIKKIYNVHFCS